MSWECCERDSRQRQTQLAPDPGICAPEAAEDGAVAEDAGVEEVAKDGDDAEVEEDAEDEEDKDDDEVTPASTAAAPVFAGARRPLEE